MDNVDKYLNQEANNLDICENTQTFIDYIYGVKFYIVEVEDKFLNKKTYCEHLVNKKLNPENKEFIKELKK